MECMSMEGCLNTIIKTTHHNLMMDSTSDLRRSKREGMRTYQSQEVRDNTICLVQIDKCIPRTSKFRQFPN